MKDPLVCGVYIPPCNSKYFDIELFDQLEQDVVHFSSTGSVILMGDFNSRTGKYSDTSSDVRPYSPLFRDWWMAQKVSHVGFLRVVIGGEGE